MTNSLRNLAYGVSEHLGLPARTAEEHTEAARALESNRSTSLVAYGIGLLCVGSAEVAEPASGAAVIGMAAAITACEVAYLAVPPLYHRVRAGLLRLGNHNN